MYFIHKPTDNGCQLIETNNGMQKISALVVVSSHLSRPLKRTAIRHCDVENKTPRDFIQLPDSIYYLRQRSKMPRNSGTAIKGSACPSQCENILIAFHLCQLMLDVGGRMCGPQSPAVLYKLIVIDQGILKDIPTDLYQLPASSSYDDLESCRC